MITLYYKPATCSLAVHVLLREIGAECELKEQSAHLDELKQINPLGNVPVIVADGFIMREGAAIMTWLCDEHDCPLLPAEGQERAAALQALMFCNATLHPAYTRIFGTTRMELDDEVKQKLIGWGAERLQQLWDTVESDLHGQDYLCGSDITLADILITVIANWTTILPVDITFGPNCLALFKRVSSRDSFREALAAEGIAEYKLLAA
jgi:glutathione S-transferase